MRRHLPDRDEQPQDPNGRSVESILAALVALSDMCGDTHTLGMQLTLYQMNQTKKEMATRKPIQPWERKKS